MAQFFYVIVLIAIASLVSGTHLAVPVVDNFQRPRSNALRRSLTETPGAGQDTPQTQLNRRSWRRVRHLKDENEDLKQEYDTLKLELIRLQMVNVKLELKHTRLQGTILRHITKHAHLIPVEELEAIEKALREFA